MVDGDMNEKDLINIFSDEVKNRLRKIDWNQIVIISGNPMQGMSCLSLEMTKEFDLSVMSIKKDSNEGKQ